MLFKRVAKLLLALPLMFSIIMPSGATTPATYTADTEVNSVAEVHEVNVDVLAFEESQDVIIVDAKTKELVVEEATEPNEEIVVETVENETDKETAIEETVVEEQIEEMAAEENIPEESIPEEKDRYAEWHTGTLTARKGYITDGPAGSSGNDGYETWYDLDMTRVVKIMDEFMREKGKQDGCVYDYEYWVREDGCKMYGPYIMVAGDIVNTRKRGDIIETSLGTALVCDYCEFAVKWNPYQIDIATDWAHTYSRRY